MHMCHFLGISVLQETTDTNLTYGYTNGNRMEVRSSGMRFWVLAMKCVLRAWSGSNEIRCHIRNFRKEKRVVTWKGGFTRPMFIWNLFTVLVSKTHFYICARSVSYTLCVSTVLYFWFNNYLFLWMCLYFNNFMHDIRQSHEI